MLINNTLKSKLIRRLLGQVLIDGEFISPNDLEQALNQQKNTRELLGEILVKKGLMNSIDLGIALSISKDLTSIEKAVRLAAGSRQNLGNLLLQAKRITPEQLESALEEQRETGEMLGEIFVRNGFLTREELKAVLDFQRYQEIKEPNPLRLGEIMVSTNQISREQLEDALSRQKISKKKIGEIFLENGYIKHHQLSYGLNLQKKLLTAVLIALMSLAPLSQNIYAGSSIKDNNSKDKGTTITEEIQRLTAMKVMFKTQEIVITPADIQRGYVEIQGAEHIEIRNNNLSGYLVVFEGLEEPFKEVIVKGLGEDFRIDSNGGWIVQPYHGRDPIMFELSYKFILSENAQPGTYTWPLLVSVSPVIPV